MVAGDAHASQLPQFLGAGQVDPKANLQGLGTWGKVLPAHAK